MTDPNTAKRSRVGESVEENGSEHRMMASTTVYVLEPGVSALGNKYLILNPKQS